MNEKTKLLIIGIFGFIVFSFIGGAVNAYALTSLGLFKELSFWAVVFYISVMFGFCVFMMLTLIAIVMNQILAKSMLVLFNQIALLKLEKNVVDNISDKINTLLVQLEKDLNLPTKH